MGKGRETGGGGQGPFWLSGAVLIVRGRFDCQGPFSWSGCQWLYRFKRLPFFFKKEGRLQVDNKYIIQV